MDIFILRLPTQVTPQEVQRHLQPTLSDFGIDVYSVDKRRGKNFAKLSILNVSAARWFLHQYGVPRDCSHRVQPRSLLSFNGVTLRMWEDRVEISEHAVRALEFEASQKASERAAQTQPCQNADTYPSRFDAKQLKCGIWDYEGDQLVFTPFYEDRKLATIIFGTQKLLILLHSQNSPEQRLYCQYNDIADIVLGSYQDPTVTIKLQVAPKFYQNAVVNLDSAMGRMSLGQSTNSEGKKNKNRLTSLDEAHAKIVGTCFVYQVTLQERSKISDVKSLLSRNPRTPATTTLYTRTRPPTEPLDRSFVRFNFDITDQSRYGNLPYNLLYQMVALAMNGILHPLKVRSLLPLIARLHESNGLDAILSALRRFSSQLPSPGPETEADMLSTRAMEETIIGYVRASNSSHYNPEDPYQLVKTYQHINLVHKIVVTPTGTFLRGPYPEPTNRVLRRYEEHIDHFLRVTFEDEDGSSVRYDRSADQQAVYSRFRRILEGSVLVAGRAFSFLGFSHSSLRAQSVWCMAPIFLARTLQSPEHVLHALGNFSNIRVPAKCAARIGQSFTDTNATVELRNRDVSTMPMVQRNGRDFSDGVGTISQDLLELVWRVYGTRRLLKPTVLQIRFQGYKGMVSLDSTLEGKRLRLRENMKKFEAPSAWNLEICGAGFRPLPMILNRQLIKILEDLGIQRDTFIDLQSTVVSDLRRMTSSAVNTAHFLETAHLSTRATGAATLIRKLGQIGLDYHADTFLYRVVGMTVTAKLRDIKYRGRIPVKDGVTLYGIMDETGQLGENEIYVTTESAPRGGRWQLVRDSVVVTRSPTMHPGDVQIVNAVSVHPASPLRKLRNVVVFSQHGTRDLSSMLSGGDLDGDLYNVIWDDRLIPTTTHRPADYPRVSAVELDRAVTRKDMSDFFVTFMQTDQLGMLANIHLQLSDQRLLGTCDRDCIKLAQMASISVDFSKTGIPVDMKQCPRYDRIRPDFMAPSPRVFVEEDHIEFEETNAEDENLQDLEVEMAPMRYYRSNKVLGHLYRAIDEQKFLLAMQQEHEELFIAAISSSSLTKKLLKYMLRQAEQYGIMFSHHKDLAQDVHAGYDLSLLDLLYQHGPSAHQPATEHEAFAGCILGRKGGAQGKPLRELSKKLREQFEAVCDYTTMRIVNGDEQMAAVNDLDVLYDDGGLDRELEALPRAIACLKEAVEGEGTWDRRLGSLQSFKYIAAGVCLKELERFMVTTMGTSSLPRF